MSRKTLLTFVGFRDPHATEGHEDGHHKGPVLTILDERKFDRVILFSRPHRRDQVERTSQTLRSVHPKLVIEIQDVDLADSTHHSEILAKLRALLAKIHRAAPDDDYTISLLSGNAEIHSCWVLIAATGEFPARLLNFRRSVHNGFAGPRLIRELDWNEPLAALTPERLSLISARRDRWDDAEQQGPASGVPPHYFGRRTLEKAVLFSRHTAPLLVSGEPGTQKQMLAAFVHQFSNRNSGPLLIINCATLPERLFESSLFGDETDTDAGKLRQADGGTLVLIKVQHVPAPVLLRLLKATDAGHYYRARGSAPVKINVRLVFTTDRDLEEEVRHGRFPAEAWRQLQPSMLRLPALRERAGDVPLLAREELARLNRTLPRPRRFSDAALAKLESHSWPSNVSELRRVVEHAVANTDQPTLRPEDLDFDLAVNMANVFTTPAPRIREGFSIEDYLRTVKHELVRSALRKTRGNQSQAARLLGLTPQAVSKLMKSVKP